MKPSTIDVIRELFNDANGFPCTFPKPDAIKDACQDFEDSLDTGTVWVDDDEDVDNLTYLKTRDYLDYN